MFDEKKLIHVFKSRYCLNTLSKKFQIYIYKKNKKNKKKLDFNMIVETKISQSKYLQKISCNFLCMQFP